MGDLTETGVDGLDSILGGGLVEDSTTLVSGGPGTGKSIFGLQFLYIGATEFDERGIYLSFTENDRDLRQAALSLGFNQWSELVESGDIVIHDRRTLLKENDLFETVDLLLEDTETAVYDRVVLDSLPMFQLFFDDERDRRTYLLKFSDILGENGLTSLFLNEQYESLPGREIGCENYLTDGNLNLIQTPTEEGINRYVWLAKMRKRDIETGLYPMEIGKGGITVNDSAADFSAVSDVFL